MPAIFALNTIEHFEMAKKKKSKKGKSSSKKQALSHVHPETKRMIVVTLFLAVAVISILALFNLAGALGEAINRVLVLFLGQLTVLFPIYFLIYG